MEAGDYRFNAVLTEELAKVNMTLPSCVGIHADIVAPYLVHLTTEEQKQRWLPAVLHRRAAHRDRHDRAVRRLRPRRAQDHRRPRRRRLGPQRLQDVHHQRRLRRPGRRGRADLAREEGPGHLAVRRRHLRRGLLRRAACSTRSARTSPTPPSSSFEDVRVSDDDLIGELDTGFISMMQFLPQERLGSAVTNLAHAAQILDETVAVRQGAQGVRPADRLLPEHPVPAGRPGHPGRGDPGVRRPVRPRAHPRRAHRGRRGQGQVVDLAGPERRPRPLRAGATAATAT